MERHRRLGDVVEVTELLQRQLDAVMFVRPLLAQMNLFSLGRSLLELWGLKAALEEVAEFIKAVAVDKKDIKDDVTEFMNQYTTVHYAFSEKDGYQVHKL